MLCFLDIKPAWLARTREKDLHCAVPQMLAGVETPHSVNNRLLTFFNAIMKCTLIPELIII